MKTTAILLILLTIIVFSCKKECIETSGNLISNWSFETVNHDSTFSGWYSTCFIPGPWDGPMPPLAQDAPSSGGTWCAEMRPLWFPGEGYAETSITGQTGNNIYKVSTWIKNLSWSGSISLQQWRNGQKISEKWLIDTSSVWKHISFLDTLNTLPADVLKIRLNAGGTEVFYGWTRFDLISLVKQ